MAFPLLCQGNNVNVVIATTSTIQNNNDELSLMKMVFAATMIPLKSFAINQAKSAEFLHSFLIHEFYYPLLKIPIANLMNNSWRLRWALCIVVRYKLIPLWIEIKYFSFEREFRFDERSIKTSFYKDNPLLRLRRCQWKVTTIRLHGSANNIHINGGVADLIFLK